MSWWESKGLAQGRDNERAEKMGSTGPPEVLLSWGISTDPETEHQGPEWGGRETRDTGTARAHEAPAPVTQR